MKFRILCGNLGDIHKSQGHWVMKRVCVRSLDEIMQTMCEVGDAYNEGQKITYKWEK